MNYVNCNVAPKLVQVTELGPLFYIHYPPVTVLIYACDGLQFTTAHPPPPATRTDGREILVYSISPAIFRR
jgi:hypothetical protein